MNLITKLTNTFTTTSMRLVPDKSEVKNKRVLLNSQNRDREIQCSELVKETNLMQRLTLHEVKNIRVSN